MLSATLVGALSSCVLQLTNLLQAGGYCENESQHREILHRSMGHYVSAPFARPVRNDCANASRHVSRSQSLIERFQQNGGRIRRVGAHDLLPSFEVRDEWVIECDFDHFGGTSDDLCDVLAALQVVELNVSRSADSACAADFVHHISGKTLRSVAIHGFTLNDTHTRALSEKFDDISVLSLRGRFDDCALLGLHNIDRLDDLELSSSMISDCGVASIMAETTALKSLRICDLTTCGNWSSVAPVSVSDLRLENCRFRKGAALCVSRLQAVEVCSLKYSSGVTDSIVTSLAAFPDLQGLDLTDTCVTIEGIAVFVSVESLRSLVLRDCDYIDERAEGYLGKMTSLERLSIEGTGISEFAASRLRARNPALILSSSAADRWVDPFVGGQLPVD